MKRIGIFAVLVAGLVFAASANAQNSAQNNAPNSAQDSQTNNLNDTARFLAGMTVSSNSPLSVIAQDPSIKQQSASLEAAFDKVEKNQIARVRAWSAANLTSPKPVLFYMFGGPDFLYANAFFPNATTYVLSGLEPVGQIPDMTKLPRWTAVQALRNIQGSLRNILTLSYFITAHMSQDLNSGPVNGTLPILYVFLARSGKTIHDVSFVHLDEQGTLQEGEGARPRAPARGVKIIFSENDGPQKTLYYFSTNLEDVRGNNIALLQFCKSLGQGDSFVKSASYLMHGGNFSQVRNFLLENSAVILQDDTGVPVRMFDTAKWELRPYGRYVGPIAMFQEMYQSKLNELYLKTRPTPIDFGLGYRWYGNESNLLLAVKNPNAPEATASISKEVNPTLKNAPTRTAEIDRAQAIQPPPQQQQVYRAPSKRPKEELPPFPFFPFFLLLPPPPQ